MPFTVDTAGTGSAAPLGDERLAAATVGVDDAATAGWEDVNVTGVDAFAPPDDVPVAVGWSVTVSCFTSSAFAAAGSVGFAVDFSDNAAGKEAAVSVTTTGDAVLPALGATGAFAGAAGADFFEAPAARGVADGSAVAIVVDVATAGVAAGAAAGAIGGAAETVACDTTCDGAPDADGLGTDETFGPTGAAAAADAGASDTLRVVDDAVVALSASGAATVGTAAAGATAGAPADETDALEEVADWEDLIGTPADDFVKDEGRAPAAGGAPVDTAGAFAGARWAAGALVTGVLAEVKALAGPNRGGAAAFGAICLASSAFAGGALDGAVLVAGDLMAEDLGCAAGSGATLDWVAAVGAPLGSAEDAPGVDAAAAVFTGAILTGAAFVLDAALDDCSFAAAGLAGGPVEGTALAIAVFMAADLTAGCLVVAPLPTAGDDRAAGAMDAADLLLTVEATSGPDCAATGLAGRGTEGAGAVLVAVTVPLAAAPTDGGP